MSKPDLLDVPAELQAQKEWAKTANGLDMDTAYYYLRALATRRILMTALDEAFERFPTLDHICLNFVSQGVMKEAVKVVDMDPDKTRTLQDKFDRMMGPVRKRMGQSRNVYDSLAVFFGWNQERRITRQNYRVAIDAVFEDIERWDAPLDAKIEAQTIDQATRTAATKRPGPRL